MAITSPAMAHLEGGGKDSEGSGMAPSLVVDSLAWTNVSYYFKTKSKNGQTEKAAVQGCTGLVKRGDMVAVMGPSGAGKSSLFDVLARRIGASGRLEGEMYVNGATVSDKDFMRISEYVQHEDVFVATQTLIQALEYHTNLRLGPSVSQKEKHARIERLVVEAGLSERLHSRIGGVLAGGISVKGLSNGEKRRLSVVCAAIANPSILFLDEPTSGLDSYAALKVIEMMSKFCAEGRLIVCTIHQPRSQVYELFNKVLILSKGQQVYFGGSMDVIDWFKTKLHRTLPIGTSVPDFVLDLINVSFEEGDAAAPQPSSVSAKGITTNNNKGPVDVDEACAIFKKSDSYKKLQDEIEASRAKAVPLTFSARQEANWLYKFQVVLWRNLLHYINNPGNVVVRLIISVIVGIFQGVVFYRTWTKDPALVQATSLLICLFVTQLQALLLPFVSMTLFIEDRKFFVKEAASRLYPTSVYYLANFVLEMVLTTTAAMIYGVLTYFLCFYAKEGEYVITPSRFIIYLAFVIAGAHNGSMQAIMCSILSPSLEVACALNVGLTCVFCFGGIPSRLLSTANVIQWGSPLKYGYTAMVESYLKGTANYMFVELMQVTEPSSPVINMMALLSFYVTFNVVAFWGLHNLYRTKH